MSAPPAIRTILERDFEKAFVQLAETLGYRCAHHSDSRKQVTRSNGARLLVGDRHAKGFPDWVLTRANRLIIAELKSEKGRVRPEQEEWLTALRQTTAGLTGLLEVYCWRPSQMPEIATVLGRGAAT